MEQDAWGGFVIKWSEAISRESGGGEGTSEENNFSESLAPN